MSFVEFLDRIEGGKRTLAVLNRDAPEQVLGLLEETFGEQPVEVVERQRSEYGEDVVLLLDGDEVVAESPLSALTESILFVNSDLYTTGARHFDALSVPDVLAELRNVPFSVQGYPESDKEKLLLIVLSRWVERLAYRHGGRLRASFQRLSRIDDEVGTRAVYERLADAAPDVHVYGVPDWTPPAELSVTMHGSHDEDLRRTWFVLYRPPTRAGDGAGPTTEEGVAPTEDADADPAALLAYETAPGSWDGIWTREPELVRDLNRYIERRY